MRPSGLEVADIFRDHGPAWRRVNRGHISLEQLKVMSAIERCRTAALGGHVAQCENADCRHVHIAYNSCRNRHCPKCQGKAAIDWLEDREAELLPVGYFHVVFTLPRPIAGIAYQNKRVIYGLLFKASAETMLTIAVDPKHLGAKIAITSVLHTWGSTMTHHPHVLMIVPGGGISRDGKTRGGRKLDRERKERWISSRKTYLLPVPVLSSLFRRLFWRCWKRRMRTDNSTSMADMQTSSTRGPSTPGSYHCERSIGSSTPKLLLAVLKRYSLISPVTRTALRFRTDD